MDYWKNFLPDTFREIVNAIQAAPLRSVCFSAVVFVVMLFRVHIKHGRDAVRNKIKECFEGIRDTVIAGAVFFVLYALIIYPTKVFSDKEGKISVLTNQVGGLIINTQTLSQDLLKKGQIITRLTEEQQKNENIINIYAIASGFTNGTLHEKLTRFVAEFDGMKQDLKTTGNLLFAAKREESFRLSDSNRVVVFTKTNQGPRIFFKLRHVPIKSTIEGTAQGPSGQMPLVGIGSQTNVLWLAFPNLDGLVQTTFIFKYMLDINNTNLIKVIHTNNEEVFFDNSLQLFNIPADD